MTPAEVLAAIRDLVAAAEEDGWDLTENRDTLDRAREAYADLQVIMADADDEEGRS